MNVDLASCSGAVLSLCSGGGGLDRGLELAVSGCRVVAHVEIEAFACEVLAKQMDEGRLAPAPIWTNLRTFDGRPYRGRVRWLTAGYPCQPFSVAGKRGGADDPRHLWPVVHRIIDQARPEFVLLENVRGHLSLGFDVVCGELDGLGYRVAAGLFSAKEVGAPHDRARLYVVAHTDGQRAKQPDHQGGALARQDPRESSGRSGGDVGGRVEGLAHANGPRLEGRSLRGPNRGGVRVAERAPWPPGRDDALGWREYLLAHPGTEPAIRRDANGLANRIDRLRILGNGVVPDQAALAVKTLLPALLEP